MLPLKGFHMDQPVCRTMEQCGDMMRPWSSVVVHRRILIKGGSVLQDLEIYIGKKKVEDGYALVARAGRVVQVNDAADLCVCLQSACS